MARPRAKELTERELEIMQISWDASPSDGTSDCGEMTAQQIRDGLAATGRDLAYTTVATLVRILRTKVFCGRLPKSGLFGIPRRGRLKKCPVRWFPIWCRKYLAVPANNCWFVCSMRQDFLPKNGRRSKTFCEPSERRRSSNDCL